MDIPRIDLIASTLIAALLLATSGASAQSTSLPDTVAPADVAQTACAFTAFVNETDPAGLNVRAGPGTAHKVLGTLPPTWVGSDDPPLHARVEVEVSASVDGWFRIHAARDNELLTEAAQRPMFKGQGWVSGRKLTVKSQAQSGRQRPDIKSAAVAIGRDGSSFDSDAFLDHASLIGCRRPWVLVEYGPLPQAVRAELEIKPAATTGFKPGRFRAWVDHICGLQETSCDGG